MAAATQTKSLTLIGFICLDCDTEFYLPQGIAGDGFKHGLSCPRCRGGEHIHYCDWIHAPQLIKAAGSDIERRCAEALTS